MVPNEWRQKNDSWQFRHFILSSFVRNKQVIVSNVYEFIDHLHDSGYIPPLGDLRDVDREVKNLYEEYVKSNY